MTSVTFDSVYPKSSFHPSGFPVRLSLLMLTFINFSYYIYSVICQSVCSSLGTMLHTVYSEIVFVFCLCLEFVSLLLFIACVLKLLFSLALKLLNALQLNLIMCFFPTCVSLWVYRQLLLSELGDGLIGHSSICVLASCIACGGGYHSRAYGNVKWTVSHLALPL